MTVLAAHRWRTNGDLIADVAKLGYLAGHVLDPTYGRGLWWTKYTPDRLSASDINGDGYVIYAHDFTALPHERETFDAVTFDPPYVAMGGRRTTGLPDFFERFGLTDAPATPRLLQDFINAGIDECVRVLKPGGYLLVKCKDYISSGRYWPGTFHVMNRAMAWTVLVDRFEMIGSPSVRPGSSKQFHARRNHSTLLVFRKGLR